MLSPGLPPRFAPALDALARLVDHDTYRAAMVFGSVARGDATDRSDVDVQVVMREENPCSNINHPVIGGVKLDLTFKSFAQLRAATEEELARRERVPMVAESIVLFDKDGDLTALRERALEARPRPVDPAEHQHMQFMLFHADDKAVRHLAADPASALLVMDTTLADMLKYHYRLHERWWISNKRLLPDLRAWDPPMAGLIESFLVLADPGEKHRIWSAILERVAAPMGGRQPIAENNCTCPRCVADLAALERAAAG